MFVSVIGSALNKGLSPGQVVAKVTILTSDGYVDKSTCVAGGCHTLPLHSVLFLFSKNGKENKS